MSGDRKESGFTLLELLISITIFAMILVALTSGFHFAGRAWDAQQQRDVRDGDVNAVQNVLRTMIGSGRAFEGDRASLRFVAGMPAALERGGLYDVELGRIGDRLVLSWRPHFRGFITPPAPQSAELLKGVVNLDMAYYEGDQGWQRRLDGKSKPPDLIAIGLRFDDGRVWPQLVTAPLTRPPAAKD
jgi:prepilin-type N-terminal cleavage/methylation domain-containing protein